MRLFATATSATSLQEILVIKHGVDGWAAMPAGLWAITFAGRALNQLTNPPRFAYNHLSSPISVTNTCGYEHYTLDSLYIYSKEAQPEP